MGNLDDSVGKLADLVEKMYTFSSNTKNLHKEMKGWCTVLYQQTGRVKKRSDALKSFTDKSSDRIDDLSISLLEASCMSIRSAVPITSIGVGTEPELVLENRVSDEQDIRLQTSHRNEKEQAHDRCRQVKITEEKRKKTKMKNSDTSRNNFILERKNGHQNKAEPRKRPSDGKNKNEVLLIKLSRSFSYADVAKKLKGNIDVSTLKVNIKTMKKTERGDLILQIGNGPKQAEATERLKTAIVEVLA